MNAYQLKERILVLLQTTKAESIKNAITRIGQHNIPNDCMNGFEDFYLKCKIIQSLLTSISYSDYEKFTNIEKIVFTVLFNFEFEQKLFETEDVHGLEELIKICQSTPGLKLEAELEERWAEYNFSWLAKEDFVFVGLLSEINRYIEFYETNKEKFQSRKSIHLLDSESLFILEKEIDSSNNVEQEEHKIFSTTEAIGTRGLVTCISLITVTETNTRISHISSNYLNDFHKAISMPDTQQNKAVFIIGGTVNTLGDIIEFLLEIIREEKFYLVKDIYLCSSPGWLTASCVIKRETNLEYKIFAGLSALPKLQEISENDISDDDVESTVENAVNYSPNFFSEKNSTIYDVSKRIKLNSSETDQTIETEQAPVYVNSK